MTSSEGLLSLVNQLQNMETAMGLFLIETALKLSTFHDTKFLVMVDLPEGRKIAGKGEMIQCFMDGKLLPSPSDVKIELVPEVSALMEYPLRDSGSCGLSYSNNSKSESRPFRPYSQPSNFRQPVSSSSFDSPSPSSALSLQHRPSSFDGSSRLMGMKSPKMATSACDPVSPKQQQQQPHQQHHHHHHQQQVGPMPTPSPHQPHQQSHLQHPHHSATPTSESSYGCGSAPISPHGHSHQQQSRKRQAYDSLQPPSLSSSPKAMKIEGRDDEDASIAEEDDEENLQSMYPEDHGSGGGDYPIPAPVAHCGGGGGGGQGVGKYSFGGYQSYHQADLNSEDQTNRIAMAQQFSYDDVKAKDSTGFKIIASIVYAKAKELAADCPIADYKGPEVNNYLRQEYLAWFARTFPRLYDTKATAMFRARMQICFQTIRKKLFPPPPQSGPMGGGGGGGGSSSLLSIMPTDMSAGNMGGTGYPDRNFGVHSLVNRREENHALLMASHSSVGHDRGDSEHHQQPQRQHHGPPIQQQQHHPHPLDEGQMNPEREESSESTNVDVKCHDSEVGGGGGDGGGRSSSLTPQGMNSGLSSMNMNSFEVGNERNDDPYPFGQC